MQACASNLLKLSTSELPIVLPPLVKMSPLPEKGLPESLTRHVIFPWVEIEVTWVPRPS